MDAIPVWIGYGVLIALLGLAADGVVMLEATVWETSLEETIVDGTLIEELTARVAVVQVYSDHGR